MKLNVCCFVLCKVVTCTKMTLKSHNLKAEITHDRSANTQHQKLSPKLLPLKLNGLNLQTPRGFSSSPPARLGLKIESGQRVCQRVQLGSQKAFYSLFLKGTTKSTMCSTKDSGMWLANKLSKRCTQWRRCIIHKHR